MTDQEKIETLTRALKEILDNKPTVNVISAFYNPSARIYHDHNPDACIANIHFIARRALERVKGTSYE